MTDADKHEWTMNPKEQYEIISGPKYNFTTKKLFLNTSIITFNTENLLKH